MIDQYTKIIMSYRELEFHDKQIKEEAYQQGASDMEKAKQIIIDKLLVEIEQIRTESIDEFAEEIKNLVYKWFESGVINTCTIDKIAEKLKENKC